MAQNDDPADPPAGTLTADDAADDAPADNTSPPPVADGASVRVGNGDGAASDQGVRGTDTGDPAADLITRAYAHDDLTELIARAAEANEALLNGDAGRYADLLPHTDDYTLMAPFGGEPIRGHDESPEARASTARFFRGGAASFDVVESYTSGDLAVLVVVERQTVRVADLPEQDWSLRATLVFRREDGRWCLAHRHADVLLPGITVERAAAIARGEG